MRIFPYPSNWYDLDRWQSYVPTVKDFIMTFLFYSLNFFWLSSIGWTLYWELWGAPLRSGGSWMVLKAVILLYFWRYALNLNWRGLQWWSLIGSFFIAEALMRAWSDPVQHRPQAWMAVFLLISTYLLTLLLFYTYKNIHKDRVNA
jgi:uncharacterized membrane protein